MSKISGPSKVILGFWLLSLLVMLIGVLLFAVAYSDAMNGLVTTDDQVYAGAGLGMYVAAVFIGLVAFVTLLGTRNGDNGFFSGYTVLGVVLSIIMMVLLLTYAAVANGQMAPPQGTTTA